MRSLALVLPLLLAGSARAGDLAVGSPAPPLSIRSWLKGAPMEGLDPAKIYVVEFWASWCGPCKPAAVHLTKLAAAYPEVTVLGVAVYDESAERARKVVDSMGARMGYAVAYSGNRDGMARSWLAASGDTSIPNAFLVRNGTIEWIGRPNELDAPLAAMRAGTFDREVFRRMPRAEDVARARSLRAQSARLDRARKIAGQYRSGDRRGARAELARWSREDPGSTAGVAALRFDWLADEDPRAWTLEAKRLARSRDSVETERLAEFAQDRALHMRGPGFARRAAEFAVAARPRDPGTLDRARRVYGIMGLDRPALDVTRRLLAVLPRGDERLRASLVRSRDALEARVRPRRR